MGEVETQGVVFHVDKLLLTHWQKINLPTMQSKNSDRVYLVDGRERIGKSTFTIQQMAVLDPNAFATPETFAARICFSAEQFNETVRNTKNGVVIFDEAFRGLSSRAALSKVNKLIIQTLMEMGQNNNIVFLVLPSFFRLDMYAAVERSDGLFHITEDKKTSRRKFQLWNRKDKNKMYQLGVRKGWSYGVKTRFRARFGAIFPGGEEYYKAYAAKKRRTFEGKDGADGNQLYESSPEFKRNEMIYKWNLDGMSEREIAKSAHLANSSVHYILVKHREYTENTVNQAAHCSKDINISADQEIIMPPPALKELNLVSSE